MHDKEKYIKFTNEFLKLNQHLNLISKNDEQYLWEKHIYDSLSINQFFKKYSTPKTLLDIGTGGGFPAIPIAITYPQIQVYALDSIRKKITAIENLKLQCNIQNLFPICNRAENLTEKFDVITSRAVAALDKILLYAIPLLKNNGYFIAYKSKNTNEEINSAEKILKKYNAKIIDIIEYQLPLKEIYTRNLIIIKK